MESKPYFKKQLNVLAKCNTVTLPKISPEEIPKISQF